MQKKTSDAQLRAARAWQERNREKYNEKQREVMKKRYEENKESIIKASSKWVEENKDHVKNYQKEYNKTYYENNKEKRKQYASERYQRLKLLKQQQEPQIEEIPDEII